MWGQTNMKLKDYWGPNSRLVYKYLARAIYIFPKYTKGGEIKLDARGKIKKKKKGQKNENERKGEEKEKEGKCSK